jgi:hypothetical protein
MVIAMVAMAIAMALELEQSSPMMEAMEMAMTL